MATLTIQEARAAIEAVTQGSDVLLRLGLFLDASPFVVLLIGCLAALSLLLLSAPGWRTSMTPGQRTTAASVGVLGPCFFALAFWACFIQPLGGAVGDSARLVVRMDHTVAGQAWNDASDVTRLDVGSAIYRLEANIRAAEHLQRQLRFIGETRVVNSVGQFRLLAELREHAK